MGDHGHSHGAGGGGGCCCSSDDLEQASVEGMRYSMNEHIDMDKVLVLNESIEGSGRKVLKAWDNRNDRTEFVESDVDEELLFDIPFNGRVKIGGIVLIGDLDDSHPSTMRIFKDRQQMSFDDAAGAADQEFSTVVRDSKGVVDYALNPAKFSGITRLAIHFPKNYGDEHTRLYYIGLRGEYQRELDRQRVTIATYEARAIPQDHKGEIPGLAMGRNVF